jgi:mRNA interferase MazF
MTELRGIHLVTLDKKRPVLVLTRHWGIQRLRRVVVAPITSTVRGAISEVAVGPANGLHHPSVVNLDDTQLIRSNELGRPIGYLLAHQERDLTAALIAAFDLEADG